jgi:hypothetical protein
MVETLFVDEVGLGLRDKAGHAGAMVNHRAISPVCKDFASGCRGPTHLGRRTAEGRCPHMACADC